MRITRTTQVADTVVTALRVRLQGVEGPEGTLYPFLNCRERGWFLSFGPGMAWAFAENRNSDDIVVYECAGWHTATPDITEAGWASARYFRTPTQAATYIAARARRSLRAAARERAQQSRLADAIAATN